MRGTSAAKYLFAACLCASTVDLIVVNFVIGPLAFPDGDAAPAEPALKAAPAATAGGEGTSRMESPAAHATATVAEAAATVAPAESPAPSVVARFESDQPVASSDELRPLAKALNADPKRRIVLEGHADQHGDPAHNRALSLERAEWAKAQLVALGVDTARIDVIAHGAERPLAGGDDDAAVASNRRVEARWLPSSGSTGDEER